MGNYSGHIQLFIWHASAASPSTPTSSHRLWMSIAERACRSSFLCKTQAIATARKSNKKNSTSLDAHSTSLAIQDAAFTATILLGFNICKASGTDVIVIPERAHNFLQPSCPVKLPSTHDHLMPWTGPL